MHYCDHALSVVCRPWLTFHIFDFFSETAEQNSTKLTLPWLPWCRNLSKRCGFSDPFLDFIFLGVPVPVHLYMYMNNSLAQILRLMTSSGCLIYF